MVVILLIFQKGVLATLLIKAAVFYVVTCHEEALLVFSITHFIVMVVHSLGVNTKSRVPYESFIVEGEVNTGALPHSVIDVIERFVDVTDTHEV